MKPIWFAIAAALAAFLVRRREKLEPTLKIGGAIVVVGCVVYGTGLVELPKVDEVLTSVGTTLGKWTYLLVGVMAFLETGAFVGLLAPGETVILVGGVVAGQGKIDLVVLIAIVWTCAVAGDLTSFFIGRRLGREFLVRHGPKVQISEERIEQVERFFERYGGKAIFLGRFVGLIRAVAPFLAGSGGMPLRRFLPSDVLGAGLWGTTFTLLGYLFWQSIDRVLEYAKTGSLALGITITLVAALVWGVRWVRETENRRRARAALEARAAQPGPARIPARLALAAAGRLMRPARFVWNRLTPGDLGLELTSLLAIGAVGAAVVAGYADLLSGDRTPYGDRRALGWADGVRMDWLTDLDKILTQLGSLPVAGGAVLLTAGVLLARREVLEGATLAGGLLVSFVAVQLISHAEDRPHPPGQLVESALSSLPSSHCAYAIGWVAIAVALRRALPGLASEALVVVLGLLIAVVVGLTRIYLHAAWLSDVLAGWGLGAGAWALCGCVAIIAAQVRQNHPGP